MSANNRRQESAVAAAVATSAVVAAGNAPLAPPSDPFAKIHLKLATDQNTWKAKNGKLGRTMAHILVETEVLGVPHFIKGSLEARWTSAADFQTELQLGGLTGRYPAVAALAPVDDHAKAGEQAIATLKAKALDFIKSEKAAGRILDMTYRKGSTGASNTDPAELGVSL